MIPEEQEYYVQMSLERRSEKYKNVPVNAVCARHRRGYAYSAPIMAVATEDSKLYTSVQEKLFYRCDERKTKTKKGSFTDISCKPAINFPCNDSCGKRGYF